MTQSDSTSPRSADAQAVRAMLNSDQVTGPTRAALLARLDARYERRFFSEPEFLRLKAVATRLVPHDPAEIDLTGLVDDRLNAGRTDGWRYDDALPDGDAYRALLGALPEEFETLPAEEQDTALRAAQPLHPHAFEDLLAELVEGFYAHPLTQYRIGYVGFADAAGWPKVGPNELERREVDYGAR